MSNKGITLISLVITIIVMIILAGVSISGILNAGTVDITKEIAFKTEAKDIKDAWESKIIGMDSTFLEYADLRDILSDLNADEDLLSKLEIQNGELVYKNDMCTQEEKQWLEGVGIFGGVSILANVKTYINIVGTEIENQTKEQAMDVMFVLDVSGSMENKDNNVKRSQKMTNTLNTVVKQIMDANPENRIGIIQFSSSAGTFIPLDHYTSVSSDGTFFYYYNGYIRTYKSSRYSTNSLMKNSSGTLMSKSIEVTGGTYTQAGVFEAYKTLNSRANKANLPAIILITDGLPTYYSNFKNGSLGTKTGNGNATTEHHGKNNIYLSAWIKKQIPDIRMYNIGISDFSNADESFMKVVLNPSDETIEEAKKMKKSGSNISANVLQNLITELQNKINNDKSTNYYYANGFAIGALSESQLKDWFKSVIDDITYNLQKGDLSVGSDNNITGVYQIDSDNLTYTTKIGANGRTEDGTDIEGTYDFKLAEDDQIKITVSAAAFSKSNSNSESSMLKGSEFTTPSKSFSIQDIKDGIEPNIYYLDGTIKWNVRSEYKGQGGLVDEALSGVSLPNDSYVAEITEIRIELPVITTNFTPKSE